MCVGSIRVEPYRFGDRRDCLVEPVEPAERLAVIDVQTGMVREPRECRRCRGLGHLRLADAQQQLDQLPMPLRLGRRKLQRPPPARFGLVAASLQLEQMGKPALQMRVRRVAPQSLLQCRDRLLDPSLPLQQLSRGRCRADGLLVELGGAVERR